MRSKQTLLAGLVIGFSTLATSAIAQAGTQMGEGYAHHPHMGSGGHHFIFPIIGIVVVLLIIGFVARKMGCGGHRCGRGRKRSDAMAILEKRYAKGEIDKAEFEERKTTLTD